MNYLFSVNNLLIILQWIFIALPLNGYIHPDEYFQSTEVMASDVLHFKSCKTWEWNCSSLSRTIIFPTAVAGLPLWLLNAFSKMFGFKLGTELLVIVPRVVMGLITFVIDRLMYQFTCSLEFTKEQSSFVTFLFRSSHVTLTFFTRTFSNNVEALLFIFILLKPTHKTNSAFRHGLIGFVNILGFFIRPSSLCFFVFPILVSTLSILHECWAGRKNISAFIKYCFMMLLGGILAAILCVLLDSWYCTKGNTMNWSITPLNLLRYNFNIENLELHGVHPWYLHLTVNMILLFGPLYFILIWKIFKILMKSSSILQNYYNLPAFLATCSILPVCILSLVPHHEPRYILPVILPLICFIATDTQIAKSKLFYISWFIFNFLGVLWFGFLHQAGVLPSLSHLSSNLKTNLSDSKVFILYWKTYKVPEHLLLQHQNNLRVEMKDLAGADWELVRSEIDTAFQADFDKILLICPSSISFDSKLQRHSKWRLENSFFPHVTTEDLPIEELQQIFHTQDFNLNHLTQFIQNTFSLNIYSISSVPEKSFGVWQPPGAEKRFFE